MIKLVRQFSIGPIGLRCFVEGHTQRSHLKVLSVFVATVYMQRMYIYLL